MIEDRLIELTCGLTLKREITVSELDSRNEKYYAELNLQTPGFHIPKGAESLPPSLKFEISEPLYEELLRRAVKREKGTRAYGNIRIDLCPLKVEEGLTQTEVAAIMRYDP